MLLRRLMKLVYDYNDPAVKSKSGTGLVFDSHFESGLFTKSDYQKRFHSVFVVSSPT